MFGEFTLFKRLAGKSLGMNRSAKGLLIVTTSYFGWLQFGKLQMIRQTLLLYGNQLLLIIRGNQFNQEKNVANIYM